MNQVEFEKNDEDIALLAIFLDKLRFIGRPFRVTDTGKTFIVHLLVTNGA